VNQYREGKVKKNPKESEIEFETECFYSVEAKSIFCNYVPFA